MHSRAKSEMPNWRLCARSAPSDAGRRPSGLGMPRAARDCARASYLQSWRPRRPPSRTTTSSDKLCADATRAATLCPLRRLSCCHSEDANTKVAFSGTVRMSLLCFCMPRLLRSSCACGVDTRTSARQAALSWSARRASSGARERLPRLRQSWHWTGHGRPSAVLAHRKPVAGGLNKIFPIRIKSRVKNQLPILHEP
jgi:hypothetical protein